MTVDPATPTADQVAEWVALAEKATEGPWRVYVSAATLNLLTEDNRVVCYVDDFGAELKKHDRDAEFIAAARTAVPALAAALSSERAVSAGLRAEVEQRRAEFTIMQRGAARHMAEILAERDALQAQVQAVEKRHADLRLALSFVRSWQDGATIERCMASVYADDIRKILDADAAALAAAQPTKETTT